MASPFDSPVDVGAAAAGRAAERPGLTAMIVAVGIAVLALTWFNTHALAAWADGLAPGARTARIAAFARGLADETAALGLDGPRTALKAQWDKAKMLRWNDQEAENAANQMADPVSDQR